MKTIFSFLLVFFSVWGFAQQTVVPAGGMANGSGGTVSYTIGQVDCASSQGSTGRVTQGVQQPYEILIVQGIEEKLVNLFASVYPNPSSDFVKLKIESDNPSVFSFEMYDLNGKLLVSQKSLQTETVIEMNGYAASTYFIKVCNSKSEIKTFKIIKN